MSRTREAAMSEDYKFRRNYQACTGCRLKKLRCDRGDPDCPEQGPCRRCRREGKECVVGPTESRGKRAVTSGAAQEVGRARSSSFLEAPPPFTSRLAHPPPKLPPPPRPSPYAPYISRPSAPSLSLSPCTAPTIGSAPRIPPASSTSAEGDAVLSTSLHNPSDAFRMLVDASTRQPDGTSPSGEGSRGGPASVAVAEWEDWAPIREGILEREEAQIFIRYFITTLSPLYPLLPPETLTNARLPILLTTESLLLLTILSISSRYLSITALSPAGEPTTASVCARSASIHSAVAALVREELSRIAEGDPDLRDVSSVEALLLLSEWPVRPIERAGKRRMVEGLSEVDRAVRTSNVYDSLSWSYIGSAVRLAQELGINDRARYSMEPDGAEDIPCGSSRPPPASWESVRELRAWAYSYNADQNVSVRLGRHAVVQRFMATDWWENMALLTANQAEDQGVSCWSPQLAWSQASSAALVATVHDRLYPSKEVTKTLLRTGQWESFLSSLKLDLEHHRNISKDVLALGTIDSELLSIEFDYVLLYGYAISLRALQERVARMRARNILIQVTLLNLSEGSWIIDALAAARSILNIVLNKLRPLGRLRICPARLFQRVLFAASFILKALAIGVIEHGQRSVLVLLNQAVEALEENVVDSDHLSRGFASLLRRLLDQPHAAPARPPLRSISAPAPQPEPQQTGQHSILPTFDPPSQSGLGFAPVPMSPPPVFNPPPPPQQDFSASLLESTDIFAGWPLSFDSTIAPFINSQAQDTLFQELWASDQDASSLSLMDTLGIASW